MLTVDGFCWLDLLDRLFWGLLFWSLFHLELFFWLLHLVLSSDSLLFASLLFFELLHVHLGELFKFLDLLLLGFTQLFFFTMDVFVELFKLFHWNFFLLFFFDDIKLGRRFWFWLFILINHNWHVTKILDQERVIVVLSCVSDSSGEGVLIVCLKWHDTV